MIRINPWIFKKLNGDDYRRIHKICDQKLEEYYDRITR